MPRLMCLAEDGEIEAGLGTTGVWLVLFFCSAGMSHGFHDPTGQLKELFPEENWSTFLEECRCSYRFLIPGKAVCHSACKYAKAASLDL